MKTTNKVLLFNPWSAQYGFRIPNSILQVAASITGKFEYEFVDGNREIDCWTTISNLLATGEFKYFASTVMPGPQLKQAIPFSEKVRKQFPHVVIIWGGYFASNQYKVAIESSFVDFIIDGPGDYAFPQLLNAIESQQPVSEISNLIYKEGGEVIRNRKQALPDYDQLNDLPYEKLFNRYSAEGYLKKTFLGRKTAAYHSSFGCPFTCSFCAVVPIYNARWKGKSALGIYNDIKRLKENHGADAVEFHDNNFFVSEKRTREFCELIAKENMSWWGEGRIDTIDKYSDESLTMMKEAGCKMIFFGAESGNDEVLAQMDKGGTQTAEQIKRFAARMRKFDIIPEYSFVLGLPAPTPEQVLAQIDQDIEFIKEIKTINPDTEIIIYVYSPVPTEGSELYDAITSAGFRFPEKLKDWLSPAWEKFDQRRNPLTPWLQPAMVDKIQNFETVLNAYYPTASDTKLTNLQKTVMRSLSSFRYNQNVFSFPYEIKLLQKLWLRYRQPELEGF